MTMSIYDGDTIEKGGRTFRINLDIDTDSGPPWKDCDGHGIISDWTMRHKSPGERVLASDRSSHRYYDIAKTMKLAKRDCWGLADEEKIKLAARLGRAPTKGEITAEAVDRDFDYLRRWCNDQWHYVGVVVTDITDDPDADNDYSHVLWGVEDDSSKHLEEVANELIDDILGELADAAEAADKEHSEAAYWAARDVITTHLPAQYERHQP